MLKFLFWILLLANAGLAAYQFGHLDTLLPTGREPTRLQRQIEPQRLHVVPEPRAAQEAAAAPAAVADAPASAPATTVAAAVEPVPACIEVGRFSQDEAQRFRAQLGPLGARAEPHTLTSARSYMVYMPPQPDRAGAERKASELRTLGIDDFFIIQDNSDLRWAISLGVFKTEEGARTHLAELVRRGVRTARVGQRSMGPVQLVLRFHGLDADTLGALRQTAAGFERKAVQECAG